MIKVLKLNNIPSEIEFELINEGNQKNIMIAGFDYSLKNLFYFRRMIKLKANEERQMSMNVPVAPHKIILIIYDTEKENITGKLEGVKVKNLQIKKMDKNYIKDANLSSSNKKIIKFIADFCYKNPRIGRYGLKDDLIIDYKKKIKDDHTSARISQDHENPYYIQIDKSIFKPFTYPGRIMTLLHEISHRVWNSDPDSEIEADRNASNLMLFMGFPASECLYCFTVIWKDDKYYKQRKEALIRHIDEKMDKYPKYYEQEAKKFKNAD